MGTVFLCSICYSLGLLEDRGLESLAHSPPKPRLLSTGISAVAVNKKSLLDFQLLDCLKAWWLGSKGKCPKRTGQKLYHLL